MSGGLEKTTSNRAELTAILKGLSLLTKPGDEVTVHTDSTYCIGVLSLNWKVKVNRDLVRAIWKVSADRQVSYRHVSTEDNRRADWLSRLYL